MENTGFFPIGSLKEGSQVESKGHLLMTSCDWMTS